MPELDSDTQTFETELDLHEKSDPSLNLPPKISEGMLKFAKTKRAIGSQSSGEYNIPNNLSLKRKPEESLEKENSPEPLVSARKISTTNSRKLSRENSLILDRILLNDSNRPKTIKENIYHTEPENLNLK